MSLQNDKIKQYLKRIGIHQDYELNKDFLFNLHIAHLENIPYENFDIINNLNYNLSINRLYNKMISNKRGGYCYELNLLFYALLKELGFKTKLITAQIVSQDGEIGEYYDHPLIVVEMTDMWLVDVGNSIWFTKPLLIPIEVNQENESSEFRIDFDNEIYKMVQINSGQNKICYQFDLKEVKPFDFETICKKKWTTPNTKYTKQYIISRFSNGTRITIKDGLLTTISNNSLVSTSITSEVDFKKAVTENFGRRFTENAFNYKE